MASIDRSHSHSLSLDEVKGVVAKLVTDVQAEYPSLISSIKWNDAKTVADLKGSGFKGKFQVDDKQLKIAIDLSLIARPFKGKVEKIVDEKIKHYFG